MERILGRRNKFHFPARCTDFSSVSVESPPTSVPSFRPVGRQTLKIENRTSSLVSSLDPFSTTEKKESWLPRSKRVRKRSKRRRFGIADEKEVGGRGRRKEISPRNRGEPRCRGSGEGTGRRKGNGSSVDEEARCRIFPAGPR